MITVVKMFPSLVGMTTFKCGWVWLNSVKSETIYNPTNVLWSQRLIIPHVQVSMS